jgi:hypothetical protein
MAPSSTIAHHPFNCIARLTLPSFAIVLCARPTFAGFLSLSHVHTCLLCLVGFSIWFCCRLCTIPSFSLLPASPSGLLAAMTITVFVVVVGCLPPSAFNMRCRRCTNTTSLALTLILFILDLFILPPYWVSFHPWSHGHHQNSQFANTPRRAIATTNSHCTILPLFTILHDIDLPTYLNSLTFVICRYQLYLFVYHTLITLSLFYSLLLYLLYQRTVSTLL